jgi:hypothetical protein
MESVERWATTLTGRILAGLACVVLVAWLGSKMHRTVLRAGGRHGTNH